jgi:hypothetical protein
MPYTIQDKGQNYMGALQQSKPGSEEAGKASVVTLQDLSHQRRLAVAKTAENSADTLRIGVDHQQ